MPKSCAKPALSFHQLLDEEMARDIQTQDDHRSYPKRYHPEANDDEDLDADFLLALKLSEELQQPDSSAIGDSVDISQELDSPDSENQDFAFAMQLQAQFEDDLDYEQTEFVDQLSKIRIQRRKIFPTDLSPSTTQSYDVTNSDRKVDKHESFRQSKKHIYSENDYEACLEDETLEEERCLHRVFHTQSESMISKAEPDIYSEYLYPDQIEAIKEIDSGVASNVIHQLHKMKQSRLSKAEFYHKHPRGSHVDGVETGDNSIRPLPASSSFITKHDADINSRTNAILLEHNLSASTGNLIESKAHLSNPVFNELLKHATSTENRRIRLRGKEDRETREKVIDPKTRLALFKLVNSGLFSEVYGVFSCGKEANVYGAIGEKPCGHLSRERNADQHGDASFAAHTPDDKEGEEKDQSSENDQSNVQHYAIKIFKTTLNEFKNREIYIKYDYRFRYRFKKQNPRKYIRVWAEKEMENLKRMKKYGILCPTVVTLKKHILVMKLIGTNGVPAPQLREANLSQEKLASCYRQIMLVMRKLFQECKLVHADLSEYNILYSNDRVYLIDVSQAVEKDHPFSLEFLRRDCKSVSVFFERKLCGGGTLTIRELFNFIVDQSLTKETETAYLEALIQRVTARKELSAEEKQLETVFLESFIPQHLDQLDDPFGEIDRINAQGNSECFYQVLTGLSLPPADYDEQSMHPRETEAYRSSGDSDSNSDELSDSNPDEDEDARLPGHRKDTILVDPEEKERQRKERKEAKKLFKALQRERRAHKRDARKGGPQKPRQSAPPAVLESCPGENQQSAGILSRNEWRDIISQYV